MHEEMNTNGDALDSALRAVAAADAGEGASSEVKARLLNEVRAMGRARRRWQMAGAALAMAATILMAVAVFWPRRIASVPESAVARLELPSNEYATPFLSLSHGGVSVPALNAQIVRMRFPRSALRSFGLLSFDASDASASESVWADVLIGDNGMASAVRFLRPAVEPRSYHHDVETRP